MVSIIRAIRLRFGPHNRTGNQQYQNIRAIVWTGVQIFFLYMAIASSPKPVELKSSKLVNWFVLAEWIRLLNLSTKSPGIKCFSPPIHPIWQFSHTFCPSTCHYDSRAKFEFPRHMFWRYTAGRNIPKVISDCSMPSLLDRTNPSSYLFQTAWARNFYAVSWYHHVYTSAHTLKSNLDVKNPKNVLTKVELHGSHCNLISTICTSGPNLGV